MHSFSTRIVPLIVLAVCLIAYTPTAAVAQEPVGDNPAAIEALINLLHTKGILSKEEIKEVKERRASGLSTSDALVDMLKQKGIISAEEALVLEQHRDAESEAPPVQPVKDWVTREELKQTKKNLQADIEHAQTKARLNEREIEQLEEQRVDPLAGDMLKASWAKRLALSGDIRLRFQEDLFDSENGNLLKPEDPTELMNTTEDTIQYRARVRLGLKAAILDPREANVGKVTAAVRLSTGSQTNPVSTNETLGDYFNKDSIVFDRYYLQWQYKPELPIWERIPQITVTGGRMPNPWFSSDLLWDDDLNFEGLAVNLLTDTLQENGWHLFLTAGAFPLQEVELSSKDKWLYGSQIGFEAIPTYGVRAKLGLAYYQYENTVGEVNDPLRTGLTDFTAPLYQQKGNTLFDIDPFSDIKTALASDFDIIDVTGLLDLTYFFPVHVMLEGTYAINTGFDKDEVAKRTGNPDIEENNQAYRFGFKVGYPTIGQFGEWNFFYYYKYLEADSVLDAFTDSDFHLGGTNARGWLAGAEYGLYKNVWLKVRWLTSNEIEGPPLATDVFQVDLNARF